MYGEIIGYSPIKEELFNSWLLSSIHNEVLNDPKWNFVGISVKKEKDLYVAVVNFSTGILGSTTMEQVEGGILLKGEYISIPEFKGNFEIKNFKTNNGYFELYVKPFVKDFFIYVYNGKGELTDRVDIFFK